MTTVFSWVAVSFGALDVREHEFASEGFEYIVVPTRPGQPLFLFGAGAELWRRFVVAPVLDRDLDDREREIAREMELVGIASRDVTHPARLMMVRSPWMTSALHELVYALLGHVAAENEITILFIKGPTLHAQGLRERAHSGDVDCWVPRGDDVRLARAMEPWGWKPAFSAFTGTRVLHSLTLRAGEWGSAVDVHAWFPGMAIDQDDAFVVAGELSEEREFAGLFARTPASALHAVISALHDARPFQGRGPNHTQIAAAASTLRAGGEATIGIGRRVGAEHALGSAFREAFPQMAFQFDRAPVPADWPWRLQSSMFRSYVEALRLIPVRERPRVMFRIMWPSPEALRSGPMADGDSAVSLWKLRTRRLKHGFHELVNFRRGKASIR